MWGVLFLSVDAVLIKFAGVSAQNAAFWRGLFIALSLSLFLMASGRLREFRLLMTLGRIALFICALYGWNTALFVFAVSHTQVANATIILSCTPFFSAIISHFLLRETISLNTALTIFFSIIGIILVYYGSLGSSDLLGNSLALLLAMTTGLLLTLLRRYPQLPRIPAIIIGALLAALALLPFTSALAINIYSLGILALVGMVFKPVASVCMLSATRYIRSADVGLFLVLEAVLAAFLAWLILNETLPPLNWLGGAIVIASLAQHSWSQASKERQGKRT